MRQRYLIGGLMIALSVHIQGSPQESGQGSTANLPSFDVASVRSNASGRGGTPSFQPGGFTATGAPLRMLIQMAYGLRPFQLIGGPSWIDTERYDVAAKTPAGPPASRDQILLMVQTLLSDRFKLRTHREQREMDVYALVLARSDGRLGPQLTPSTIDCAAIVASRKAQGLDDSSLAAQKERPVCVDRLSTRSGPSGVTLMYVADAKTVDGIAQMIAPVAERPIVNRTGLAGVFDFQLQFMRPQARSTDQTAVAGDAPGIFTAVEEQLGLKLISDRAPIDVLVIDSVERPSDN